jgi:hypothetical protein
MRNLGLDPDPWQADVLEGGHPRLLLNCCRQAGKSTAVALLGLAEAVFVPGTMVLLLSRSHRQSMELFRIVTGFYRRLDSPFFERQTPGLPPLPSILLMELKAIGDRIEEVMYAYDSLCDAAGGVPRFELALLLLDASPRVQSDVALRLYGLPAVPSQPSDFPEGDEP